MERMRRILLQALLALMLFWPGYRADSYDGTYPALGEVEEYRLFHWAMNPKAGNEYFQAESRNFAAEYATGPGKTGTPSSDDVVLARFEEYHGLPYAGLGTNKCLWFGSTDYYVAFGAEGNINPGTGAISFWLKGHEWDIEKDVRKTVLVFEGEDGAFSFENYGPGKLGIISRGEVLDIPLPEGYDPNLLQHWVINYSGGMASVFLNRIPLIESVPLTMPSGFDTLRFGQVGPGTANNRYLDDIGIYSRPLGQPEITSIYALEGRKGLPKEISVIRTRNPINIDGYMDEGEWADAAMISGMLMMRPNLIFSFPTSSGALRPQSVVADKIYVTYDEEYLYVAYHCPPPSSIEGQEAIIVAMLQTIKTVDDSDVEADDAFTVQIVEPYPYGDRYNLTANHAQTRYDFTVGGSHPDSRHEAIDIHWNPDWKVASSLTIDGWVLEMKIPFADISIPHPDLSGTWHMNFYRWWRTILSGHHGWAYGNRMNPDHHYFPTPAGKVHFLGEEGVVVELHSVGEVQAGEIAIRAAVKNLSSSDAAILAVVESNSGEIDSAREFIVPTGTTLDYAYDAQVRDYRTGEFVFRVEDSRSGQNYFVSGFPVMRPERPEVYIRKYPSHNLSKYEIEFISLSHVPIEELVVELAVAGRETGEKVFSRQYSDLSRYELDVEIDVEDWPYGAYDAAVNFIHNGDVLASETAVYEKNPLPEWYGNTIGYDRERPAHPWDTMERTEETVFLNFRVPLFPMHSNNRRSRSYDYGNHLFPRQVNLHGQLVHKLRGGRLVPVTENMHMLRSPMGFHIETADAGVLGPERKADTAEWTYESGTRVERKSSLLHGRLKIENRSDVEYDGFSWNSVTLSPAGGDVLIESMVFEIPFNPAFSDVQNACDYTLRNTREVHEYSAGVAVPIWVGNAYGGIQWTTETDAPYNVASTGNVKRVVPSQDGASIQIVMVDEPLLLTQPRTFEFGFIATPVRPDMRNEMKPQNYQFHFAWYPGENWDYRPGHELWMRGSPMINQSFSRAVGYAWGKWWANKPYVVTNAVPVHLDAVYEFADEWASSPETRVRGRYFEPQSRLEPAQHSDSFRDWFVWRYDRLFRDSPFMGIYYDVSNAYTASNPYAGSVYVRDDGSYAATVSVRAMRDITKRLYNIINHYYPQGSVKFHSSGQLNMPYMGFSNRFWDGENFSSGINPAQPTFRRLLTPERYRAHYMGTNWGPVMTFLGQGRPYIDTVLKYGAEELVDHVHGLQMLHRANPSYDHIAYRLLSHSTRVMARLQMVLEQYPLYSGNYDFIPYWEHEAATPLMDAPEDAIYSSFYMRRKSLMPDSWTTMSADAYNEMAEFIKGAEPRQVVLIVCNESDWSGTAGIKVEWEQLGFDGWEGVRAKNAVHPVGYRILKWEEDEKKDELYRKPEETAWIEDGILHFPLTEWNYRMIVLEQD